MRPVHSRGRLCLYFHSSRCPWVVEGQIPTKSCCAAESDVARQATDQAGLLILSSCIPHAFVTNLRDVLPMSRMGLTYPQLVG